MTGLRRILTVGTVLLSPTPDRRWTSEHEGPPSTSTSTSRAREGEPEVGTRRVGGKDRSVQAARR